MDFPTALTEFLLSKDHSAESRRWYRSRLGAFFEWGEKQSVTTLDGVTAPLVRRYVDERRTAPCKTGKPLDSHTLNGHVRAIRAFLHWAAAEDLLDEKVPQRIKPPKKEVKLLQVLSPQQIDRLFLAASRSTMPLRDEAVLAALLDTGLRANELCSLLRSDVHLSPEDSYLTVRVGKGRRQREVPLGRRARLALARYLRSHREPEVFLGKMGPLTPSGLDQLLYRLVEVAGPQHFTGLKQGAHLYRHTMAVRYLETGGDIYRLSRLMGHSNVTTTEGYLRAFTSRQARQAGISPLDTLGR